MQTVLYLTPAGTQFWCKSRAAWQAHDSAPTGPVWVVTDLAEESFTEIKVPRIFGRDRLGFVARQLASQFPDTPFCTALSPPNRGSFMDRIAPPHQTLLGVDAAQRVNAALNALSMPLAGVWAMSMLLAQIGCHKTLPPDVFVVLPQEDALRIVVIKDHLPVLSRLIPGVTQTTEQAAEIIRTLRHLEDTRVLNRSRQAPGVLMLGEPQGLSDLLAPERLELLLPPAPWAKKAPADWRFALFDLALTAPAGQLAPLPRRTKYIAARVRQLAYVVTPVSLALALWVASDNLRAIFVNLSDQSQIQDQTQKLVAQIADVEQKIAGYGVPHELLHQAITLDQQELVAAPSLAVHLKQLGQVMGQHPGLRFDRLEWRTVLPGQPICASATPSAAPTPQVAATDASAGAQATVPQRQVEISFDIALPPEQQPRARARSVASVSAMLTKLNGATLLQDPAKELKQATLSGGGVRAGTEKPPSWCLTLSAPAPSPATTAPNLKP